MVPAAVPRGGGTCSVPSPCMQWEKATISALAVLGTAGRRNEEIPYFIPHALFV